MRGAQYVDDDLRREMKKAAAVSRHRPPAISD
jgi:hypothetical protein